MNREVLESQWTQIREILHDRFSNLTEEDIRQINGRYDQLVAKLQQKYGYSREEAEERIRSWNFDRLASPVRNPTFREERTYFEDKDRMKDETSTFWKWFAAIAIPLLLLGAYYFSTVTPDMTQSPTVTQEQVVMEAPADRAISNGLRNMLMSQQNMALNMQNVRITTQNGVVTLSGSVSSNETRDFIARSAQNYAGVRQVINNLQVK